MHPRRPLQPRQPAEESIQVEQKAAALSLRPLRDDGLLAAAAAHAREGNETGERLHVRRQRGYPICEVKHNEDDDDDDSPQASSASVHRPLSGTSPPELLEPALRLPRQPRPHKQAQPRVRVLVHEADVVGPRVVVQRDEGPAAHREVVDDVGQDARDQGEELRWLLCAQASEGTVSFVESRRRRSGDAPCRRTRRWPCAATRAASCPRRRAGPAARQRPATGGTRATVRRPS